MLGIVRNKTYSWRNSLRSLPIGFLEVLSFGYLTMSYNKIIKNYDSWKECLMFLLDDFVIVFSFGYLTTSWRQEL